MKYMNRHCSKENSRVNKKENSKEISREKKLEAEKENKGNGKEGKKCENCENCDNCEFFKNHDTWQLCRTRFEAARENLEKRDTELKEKLAEQSKRSEKLKNNTTTETKGDGLDCPRNQSVRRTPDQGLLRSRHQSNYVLTAGKYLL